MQSWLQAAFIESTLLAVTIIIARGATCQDYYGDRYGGFPRLRLSHNIAKDMRKILLAHRVLSERGFT